jgi:hypothetical protein
MTEWDKESYLKNTVQDQACVHRHASNTCASKAEVSSYPTTWEMRPRFQEWTELKDLTKASQPCEYLSIFCHLCQSHNCSIVLFRGWPVSMPACRTIWAETSPTHKNSQGVGGSLGFPRSIFPFWFLGLPHKYTSMLTLHVSVFLSWSLWRANTHEILRNNKVFHLLSNLEDLFSRISKWVGSHLLGSQRLNSSDKVLNRCPLLMLNSQQSAWDRNYNNS